ncbi:gp056R [Rabbit fibroma virus]|uniref:Gp056R n=1 Tax=Rabbit fibroma virus (strain Kasza) TaxID=10272 RepID=Q9Q915_RFVKA|nr:gp056R [Rabbit fibroma virus]AAF17938.1 gp056R [Rabbit fibroma virus]
MASENILLDKIQHMNMQNNINEKFLDCIIDHVISKRRAFVRPFLRLFFDLLIVFMIVIIFTQRLVIRNWQLVLIGATIYSIMELNKYRCQLGSDKKLPV